MKGAPISAAACINLLVAFLSAEPAVLYEIKPAVLPLTSSPFFKPTTSDASETMTTFSE